MPAIWAAAISGAGALGAGILGSNAQADAAKTSAAGSAAALAETQREFNIGQANEKPYQVTGTSALNTLAKMYGLDTYTPAYAGTTGGTGAAGAPSSDAATLQAIKQGAQQWESALPGNGAGIISLIDSGAPLSQVNSALQALRATTTNPRNTAYLDPLISAGQSQATTPAGTFTAGTGAGGTGATAAGTGAAPDYSAFYASPDYNYRLSQSMDALTAQQAKLGLLDSGATQKAALQRAGDLASGEFNNFANKLQSLAGIGQTTATNSANQGQTYANTVGNIQQNAANTQASSYLGQANAWAKTIGDIGGAASNAIARNATPTGFDTSGVAAAYNPSTPGVAGYYTPGPQGFDPRGFA